MKNKLVLGTIVAFIGFIMFVANINASILTANNDIKLKRCEVVPCNPTGAVCIKVCKPVDIRIDPPIQPRPVIASSNGGHSLFKDMIVKYGSVDNAKQVRGIINYYHSNDYTLNSYFWINSNTYDVCKTNSKKECEVLESIKLK